jgi:hypothetical protein
VITAASGATRGDRTPLTATFLVPFPCACCGGRTWIRLKGLPFCSPCAISAIEARSRQLYRDPTTAAVPWPVEPIFCRKRGHFPLKGRRPPRRATSTNVDVDSATHTHEGEQDHD